MPVPGDAVQTGLADNVAELLAAVDRSGFGSYILVCHSIGGLTVLAAEPQHRTTPAHRVFVSAVTPADGRAGIDKLPLLFAGFSDFTCGARSRRAEPCS